MPRLNFPLIVAAAHVLLAAALAFGTLVPACMVYLILNQPDILHVEGSTVHSSWLSSIVVVVGSVLTFMGALFTAIAVFIARCLRRGAPGQMATICIALEWLIIPVGTILGIAALYCLTQPSRSSESTNGRRSPYPDR